jgi:hypothetical protein
VLEQSYVARAITAQQLRELSAEEALARIKQNALR